MMPDFLSIMVEINQHGHSWLFMGEYDSDTLETAVRNYQRYLVDYQYQDRSTGTNNPNKYHYLGEIHSNLSNINEVIDSDEGQV